MTELGAMGQNIHTYTHTHTYFHIIATLCPHLTGNCFYLHILCYKRLMYILVSQINIPFVSSMIN